MQSANRSRKILLLALLVGSAALSGCESVREAAGIAKEPPDEFAVVTKGALIIPPDYNLRPPKSGAAPLNQMSPTDTAQSTLFGSDPNTIAQLITGSYSQGEKMLLANADAANPDHSIRQQIASDNAQQEGADQSFTNQVLFDTTPKDTSVNADSENHRIIESKEEGSNPGNNQPIRQPTDSATIDKNGSMDSGDSGWFSWLPF